LKNFLTFFGAFVAMFARDPVGCESVFVILSGIYFSSSLPGHCSGTDVDKYGVPLPRILKVLSIAKLSSGFATSR
jgi:hypothetical protein